MYQSTNQGVIRIKAAHPINWFLNTRKATSVMSSMVRKLKRTSITLSAYVCRKRRLFLIGDARTGNQGAVRCCVETPDEDRHPGADFLGRRRGGRTGSPLLESPAGPYAPAGSRCTNQCKLRNPGTILRGTDLTVSVTALAGLRAPASRASGTPKFRILFYACLFDKPQ